MPCLFPDGNMSHLRKVAVVFFLVVLPPFVRHVWWAISKYMSKLVFGQRGTWRVAIATKQHQVLTPRKAGYSWIFRALAIVQLSPENPEFVGTQKAHPTQCPGLQFVRSDHFYSPSPRCLRQQAPNALADPFLLLRPCTVSCNHANCVRLPELDENAVEDPPPLAEFLYDSTSGAERDVD